MLDRTKEPGSLGEPLYEDVCAALYENGKTDVEVVGGRYGLGSKEFNPTMVKAVYDNLARRATKNHFTVGIEDDVTGTCLPLGEQLDHRARRHRVLHVLRPWLRRHRWRQQELHQDHRRPHRHVRAGLLQLRLQEVRRPDRQPPALRQDAHPVAPTSSTRPTLWPATTPAYVTKYDMVSNLKDGGVFLLNSPWSAEEMDKQLPANDEAAAGQEARASFYTIDAIDLALKVGMGNRINTIMQAAFFKLADVIPYEQADEYMKAYAKKTYGKKGDAIVKKNWDAIDIAISGLVEIKVPQPSGPMPPPAPSP